MRTSADAPYVPNVGGAVVEPRNVPQAQLKAPMSSAFTQAAKEAVLGHLAFSSNPHHVSGRGTNELSPSYK